MIFSGIYNRLQKKFKGPIGYARYIGVTIGENCKLIDNPDWGSEPYLITVGNHVYFSSKCSLVTHDGSTWCFRDEPEYKHVLRYGAIEIKDNCFIGMGVTILPNVTIGPNSIVGAGSLVTKDVQPNSVYAGVPAKFICTMDEYKTKCKEATPPYNLEAYRTDKQKVVMEMVLHNK
ncbi:MAG: acyltransferase [Tidjanibacter sp.]|nr:acyltransferase [Tidjanibacter sp.]